MAKCLLSFALANAPTVYMDGVEIEGSQWPMYPKIIVTAVGGEVVFVDREVDVVVGEVLVCDDLGDKHLFEFACEVPWAPD